MTRTFTQYTEDRAMEEVVDQVVENLLDDKITPEDIYGSLTACKTCNESVIYNELMAGLGNLAGAGLDAAARGVGNMAKSAWGGLQQAGQQVGNTLNQVGQQAGQAYNQASQKVGNVYMQGENKGKINRSLQMIGTLQKELAEMGYKGRAYETFQRLTRMLTDALQKVEANPRARFRPHDPNAQQPQQPQGQQAQPQAPQGQQQQTLGF